jgi:putative FmdB family regulatory protein
MPVYDYRCTDCETPYDVFHKGKEIAGDIVCPSCGSNNHKKLMSVPSIAIGGKSDTISSSGGGCASGMCGLN